MIPSIAIQLGRLGDLINILPACKHLGITHVMCCEEFLPALRGQSYVEPVIWGGDQQDVAGARLYAHTLADNVLVTQMDGNAQHLLPRRWRESYVMDQWDRLQDGFGDMWGKFPLVYDKRDKSYEKAFVSAVFKNDKPMLLVNLRSCSTHFDSFAGPNRMEATMAFLNSQSHRFQVVDMQAMRVFSLCDLLGLFEAAAGLVVADTMALHLARATPNLPSFQFVRPDRDATPLRDDGQPYNYCPMDRLEKFLDRIENRKQ